MLEQSSEFCLVLHLNFFTSKNQLRKCIIETWLPTNTIGLGLVIKCSSSSFCLYQKGNNCSPCFQTLPCLVRMCSKERLLEERVEGAETLAYLIEPDVELQRIASITDHLIAMLADYFKYPSSVSAITDIKRVCSSGFLKCPYCAQLWKNWYSIWEPI